MVELRGRAFRQGDMVRYEVQDNGVAINPDDQPCAFEPHTRFHHNLADGSGQIGGDRGVFVCVRLGREQPNRSVCTEHIDCHFRPNGLSLLQNLENIRL